MVSDVRYAILGLLAEEPGCGYELTKRFAANFGRGWQMTSGQVYGILRTLQKDGLVVSWPDTRGGREIKCYRITEAGERKFQRWREEPLVSVPPYRESLYLKMVLLEPHELPRLLTCVEIRERNCIDRLHSMGDNAASAESVETDEWRQVVLEIIEDATTTILEGELRWLERVKKSIEVFLRSQAGKERDSAARKARRTA
jgi:DNA-binding PadR family transcriptional regulator